jgi:hypothetical protein
MAYLQSLPIQCQSSYFKNPLLGLGKIKPKPEFILMAKFCQKE